MASFSGRGAAAGNHLRVLLPFTCNSLRIPDELAEEIGAGEALVVGPPGSGKEVWPVEVGRDNDGAFLWRGWPAFAAACGAGAGWFLVVRHRGRGLLTVKVFDDTRCLRDLGAPPAVEAALGSKGAPHKRQFISVLSLESLEKMLIPPKFAQNYIPKEYLNNCVTVVLRPLGKIGQIELKMNQSDVFLTGVWSQFMVSQGITGANALLLRFEGNRVFTVKVFEPNGCQRGSRNKDIRVQQDTKVQQPFVCPQKCCRNREKKAKVPMTLLDKASILIKAVYEIGPPSWIKKQLSTNTLKELGLAAPFSDAIGLRKPCTIMLTTSTNNMGPWQVGGYPRKNKGYILRQGWTRFCEENNLMEGDICTFNIVETTLWHVTITRYKEKGTLSASSPKRKSENDRSCSEQQKRLKGSMTSFNGASSTTTCAFEMGSPAWIKKEINANSIEKQFKESLSANQKHKSKSNRSSSNKEQKSYKTSFLKASFEIGPPAWIKEMNASTIERQFCLPLSFCKAIGLLELCTITLKASMSSSKSWLACLHHYQNGSQMYGSGWTSFCYENEIRVGDVCTFKIVETTLWHVIIDRREASTR
ncbi:unnamed protein product [Urochloa decumbens]|uniref:TF-B3 domain-containing protein n=1 Tax=Urochloa decumbens TaxID=240449 RepID=A0ABC9CYN3_9POAL